LHWKTAQETTPDGIPKKAVKSPNISAAEMLGGRSPSLSKRHPHTMLFRFEGL